MFSERPLTEDELIAVQALRERGFDPVRIARVIKRSRATVYRRIEQLERLAALLPDRRKAAP